MLLLFSRVANANWVVYNEAKKYLMSGDIDLNTSTIRMGLYTSASNAATVTLSRHDQLTDEVTEANGYSSSGKALVVAWTAGASAGQYKFSFTPPVWTATGGAISNLRYSVIFVEGASAGARKLLASSELTATQFTLPSGDRLTVTDTTGVFTLV